MEQKKAIVGISGGVDSAVSAKLCQQKGMELIAVLMPYGKRNSENAKIVIDWLKPNKVYEFDITDIVDRQIKLFEPKLILDEVDMGNIMARERMIIQYAISRKENGLVIGTENFTEYMLGYFTKHGDEASDMSVIKNLYKTEVWELAKKLGVPQCIIDQKPSANLWEGQTDEGELGFDYKTADKVIKRIMDTQYKRQ